MKKIFSLMIIFVLCVTGCAKEINKDNDENDKLVIMSTIYPGYDFARAITNNSNNIEVKMLLKPGAEVHDFEPTPQDIIAIKNSKIFIYVGGESDEWLEDIIGDIDTSKTKIIKLIDIVNLLEEEIVEGMEAEDDEEDNEETEYDEHVWTSPINAIKIVKYLTDEIIKIDSDNKKLYEENSEEYIKQLEKINTEIKEIVNNSKRKEIIFGDRFPLRYFTEEYGLSYYAAFPGCSDATEASSKTITYLIKKVKEDKIPVVFHIELSNKKIAQTIAAETGAKVLEFNSAHNISQKDFDAGVTYIDIMKKNIDNLKEALN